MPHQEIEGVINSALRQLKQECPPLDFLNVHERSITHRLAVHMEPLFPGWNVDCEYDKDGDIRKAVEGIADCNARKKTDDIFPDIIVHHRTRLGADNNLLVIEMKKENEEDVCDTRKLELLTDPQGHYRYQFGLYINVVVEGFVCTWYENGHRI